MAPVGSLIPCRRRAVCPNKQLIVREENWGKVCLNYHLFPTGQGLLLLLVDG